MKHFSIWQWADFVRGLGDAATRTAMDAHLSSPCQRCQRVADTLGRVASIAQTESAYEPPQHAVRYARALYAMRPEKASLPRMVARLVHDSFRAPLAAGMRSQHLVSRRALFEAGSYCLDLQLEHQPASGMVMLIGQLARRDEPATSTVSVPVWLEERKKLTASTFSSRLGEFQLEYSPARDVRLHIPLPAAGKRLEIPLDRLDPGRSERRGPTKTARRRDKRPPKRG